MSLTTDDLLKIEKIFDLKLANFPTREEIKTELNIIKDILVQHDNYIRNESRILAKQTDENTERSGKNEKTRGKIEWHLDFNM